METKQDQLIELLLDKEPKELSSALNSVLDFALDADKHGPNAEYLDQNFLKGVDVLRRLSRIIEE